MSTWFTKGLKTGIVTTQYPDTDENTEGITPGFPDNTTLQNNTKDSLISICPVGALTTDEKTVIVNREKCIHCFRCINNKLNRQPLNLTKNFEWAVKNKNTKSVPQIFKHSLHIRILDAGNCGACLNEVTLLNNPFYNMHRLGFFITPTPRKADVLIVVGPVTDHMKTAMLKTYDAMPEPKWVMAVGSCALSGGIFGKNFITGTPVENIVPVDVKVPGCPPPPLAILHGLLVLADRK